METNKVGVIRPSPSFSGKLKLGIYFLSMTIFDSIYIFRCRKQEDSMDSGTSCSSGGDSSYFLHILSNEEKAQRERKKKNRRKPRYIII